MASNKPAIAVLAVMMALAGCGRDKGATPQYGRKVEAAEMDRITERMQARRKLLTAHREAENQGTFGQPATARLRMQHKAIEVSTGKTTPP